MGSWKGNLKHHTIVERILIGEAYNFGTHGNTWLFNGLKWRDTKLDGGKRASLAYWCEVDTHTYECVCACAYGKLWGRHTHTWDSVCVYAPIWHVCVCVCMCICVCMRASGKLWGPYWLPYSQSSKRKLTFSLMWHTLESSLVCSMVYTLCLLRFIWKERFAVNWRTYRGFACLVDLLKGEGRAK